MPILYLWDIASTLFNEKWNKELTGFDSIQDYAISKGVDINDARAFENCHYEPYIHGEMFNLGLNNGFKEVLSWTKNNETFSTGFAEQMDWRARYLNPKVGFDIRQFFQKFNSTFDYSETNIKTKEMLVNYLNKKIKQGYNVVVYTDDKLANLELFKNAAVQVGIDFRAYHILNDDGGIRKKDNYIEIGSLLDILKNESTYEQKL